MAAIPDPPPEIARLLARSDSIRSRIGSGVGALRDRIDAPARAIRSIRSHPLRWAGGALAGGLGLGFLFRRKVPSAPRPKPRGFTGLLASLVLSAAKPAIKSWITGRIRQFILSRLARIPAPRHPGQPPSI